MRKKGVSNLRSMLQLTAITIVLLTFAFFLKGGFTGYTIYESQPDETSGIDSYIRQGLDANYGSTTTMQVGRTGSGAGVELRSLIQFDVSLIPVSNTVTSAVVQLYFSSLSGNSITIKAYRLTSAWNELEVGWNNKTTSEAWTTAGGDYAEETDSKVIDSTGWHNFTITSVARGWVNGTYENNGIILISQNAVNGNYTLIYSSDYAAPELRPKITVDYTANAVPTISEISADTSPSSPKNVNSQITFTISWSDLEGNSAKAYICNSSSITISGCADKTLCASSTSSTSPLTCSYTANESDNRTQIFYASVCDANCSEANSSYFYVNHAPNITLVQPNGGETLNQSQGNYRIKFNVSDSDSDYLTANIYYGETQNSTTYLINSSLNLTSYCTDPDSKTSTGNNCSYFWNTTSLYGAFYLTIIPNDSFITASDSSDSSFNIRSLFDSTPPNILAKWTESEIYSGKLTKIYANISEEHISSVWAEFNFTHSNVTLANVSATEYNSTFTAPAVGDYKFRIYARDTTGNLNTSSWQDISVTKPNASSQDENAPSVALPYSTVKVQASLNATNSLKNVYAYLNVPDGFTFLSAYPQNLYLGNFSDSESKTAVWFLSVPITQSTYSVNITYADAYSNTWASSNMQTQVTSAVGGGGAGYTLDIEGYPYVTRGENYTVKSYFTQNGVYVQPDAITVTMLDSVGSKLSDHPALMTNLSTGIFNYSRKIDTTWLEGQWETIINATKSGTSYYAHQFWRVTGTLFDVRNLTIVNPSTEALSISFILENKGTKSEDMNVFYNLTKESTGEQLDAFPETIGVNAGESKQWSVSGSPGSLSGLDTKGYVGQVRITITGTYPGGKAGAYKIFSTTSGNVSCGDGTCNGVETCSSCPVDCGACPTAPSGGGGGGAAVSKKADISIEAEKNITLAKNIEKTIKVKITNTGEVTLNNILLSLSGLEEKYYTLTPLSISSLKAGKTAEFSVKFFITDFTGGKEFLYSLKSDEISKTEEAVLNIVSMKEYFTEEVLKLERRMSVLKEKLTDEQKKEMESCQKSLDLLKIDIEKEEFINARYNLDTAVKCVDDIENKITSKINISPFAGINISSYWVWIITWALIIILIITMIIIIYLIYRKLSLANFMKTEGVSEKKTGASKDYLDKRIKDLEKKVGARGEEEETEA